MLGRTLIIAGGSMDFEFAGKYLSEQRFDTVACADAGLDAANELGISVDYVMGDFDSVSGNVLERYHKLAAEAGKAEFVKYPAEKDATDLQLVLDWVADHRPDEIVVLGATGRRLDHFLANVNILMGPLKKGISTYIIDKHNKLYLLDQNRTIRQDMLYGKYISFIPLTQVVHGVRLKGFRYELNARDMTIGDSLGVSNEIPEGQEALVELDDGVLIVVESRD